MKNNREIDEIKQKILPILKDHKVTKAGIFGSYARGEQKKRSDVDILIEIDNSADLFDLIRLQANLEKEVKSRIIPEENVKILIDKLSKYKGEEIKIASIINCSVASVVRTIKLNISAISYYGVINVGYSARIY